MSDLLTTLPGDIPGLLRRGSPIGAQIMDGWRQGTVVLLHPAGGGFAHYGIRIVVPFDEPRAVALDLTDPTGRWHAALWADQHLRALLTTMPAHERRRARDLLDHARRGLDMTSKAIDELARLVLRLAGRAP